MDYYCNEDVKKKEKISQFYNFFLNLNYERHYIITL